MRVIAPLIVVAAIVALVVVYVPGDDDEARGGRTGIRFLEGGRDAFEQRVASERGTPVVVNKWASWCGPCRAEFPYFASQAKKRRGETVFLGVNSSDNRGDAGEFLRANPVPFPSFEDPDLEIAASFNGVQAFPTTAYYDADGELAYIHQGAYASEAKLAEDIERYTR